MQSSALLPPNVNSAVTSSILIGIISQFWLRSYHPGWFIKYNYTLAGALDGGSQVMVFILAFAVFGASGTPRPFPSVSSSNTDCSCNTWLYTDTCSGLETLARGMWIVVMEMLPFLRTGENINRVVSIVGSLPASHLSWRFMYEIMNQFFSKP